MNQQPELFFPSYPMSNANRSPGSGRPGYNTTAGLPGVNRMNQRQMENVNQSQAALYPNDDRFASYDSNAFRHSRLPATPGFSDGFLGNSQAWAYNAGANTVNGAMGDNRLRSGARRGIPQVRLPAF